MPDLDTAAAALEEMATCCARLAAVLRELQAGDRLAWLDRVERVAGPPDHEA